MDPLHRFALDAAEAPARPYPYACQEASVTKYQFSLRSAANVDPFPCRKNKGQQSESHETVEQDPIHDSAELVHPVQPRTILGQAPIVVLAGAINLLGEFLAALRRQVMSQLFPQLMNRGLGLMVSRWNIFCTTRGTPWDQQNRTGDSGYECNSRTRLVAPLTIASYPGRGRCAPIHKRVNGQSAEAPAPGGMTGLKLPLHHYGPRNRLPPMQSADLPILSGR
jgi:hypothetical protein